MSTTDLLLAALADQRLPAALEACGVSAAAVREYFQTTPGQDFEVTGSRIIDRRDGGFEVHQHATVESVFGRASVLAQLPVVHGLDSVDIFVAELFDPSSETTRILCVELRVDRERLVSQFASLMGRYGGLSLPALRVVEVDADPIVAAWVDRDRVLETVRATLRPGTYWTSRLDGESLLLYVERTGERETLHSALHRGDPVQPH